MRRSLRIDGYATLAEVGFDGPWISPYQKASCSPVGPVLLAYNWLDVPSINLHRSVLQKHGFLPTIPFNRVLDRALNIVGIQRADLYLTQVFHLLPSKRSATISPRDIETSFSAVTVHELVGRKVIAFGMASTAVCQRHSIEHIAACHPSARGRTYESKAIEIAHAIEKASALISSTQSRS